MAKPFPIQKYANVQAFEPAPTPKPVLVERSAERAIEVRRARKCDQASRVMDAIDRASKRFADQIAALAKRKSALDKRRQKIEDRIITELQEAGFERYHGIRVEFSLRPAPLAVQVVNESEIPTKFLRETFSTAPDKMAIKTAIQAGEVVPGCKLTQKVSLTRK